MSDIAIKEQLKLLEQLLEEDTPDPEAVATRIRLSQEAVQVEKGKLKAIEEYAKPLWAAGLAVCGGAVSLSPHYDLKLTEDRRMVCNDAAGFLTMAIATVGLPSARMMLRSDAFKPSEAARGWPEGYGKFFEAKGDGLLKVSRVRKRGDS